MRQFRRILIELLNYTGDLPDHIHVLKPFRHEYQVRYESLSWAVC
jgi:hypothetical protein